MIFSNYKVLYAVYQNTLNIRKQETKKRVQIMLEIFKSWNTSIDK